MRKTKRETLPRQFQPRQWSANNQPGFHPVAMSLKKIAKTLNVERVPPPRGSKRKVRPSWVYTAIREMLRRELYIGRQVWNKRKYMKKPGTNKRDKHSTTVRGMDRYR